MVGLTSQASRGRGGINFIYYIYPRKVPILGTAFLSKSQTDFVVTLVRNRWPVLYSNDCSVQRIRKTRFTAIVCPRPFLFITSLSSHVKRQSGVEGEPFLNFHAHVLRKNNVRRASQKGKHEKICPKTTQLVYVLQTRNDPLWWNLSLISRSMFR